MRSARFPGRLAAGAAGLAAVAFLAAGPGPANAEEAGSGHYFPGGMASVVDTLPGKPGPVVEYMMLAYDADASKSFPIAGLVSAGLDATVVASNLAFLYETDLTLFGGKYAAAAVLPLLSMEVRGNLAGPINTFDVSDDESGLGDMVFYPFFLGWKAAGGDLKTDVRLGIYAPTGEFEAGKLTNLGKNYWTFEPSASVSWMSSTIGTEVSAFTGFDINTENEATDYESGSSWHLDVTAAQHLPLAGGFVGVGVDAFAYVQITDDSGSGAKLGGFRGHTVGIGPEASYIREVAGRTIAAEFKWLPEIDTDNRLQGDMFWLKLALLF